MRIELIVEEKVTRTVHFNTADYIQSDIADYETFKTAELINEIKDDPMGFVNSNSFDKDDEIVESRLIDIVPIVEELND